MAHKNKFLQANGCSLYLTEAIKPDSDSIIIVLHGGPGSGAEPVVKLPAFQELENHFSLVYFDQRGSGKSEYNLLQGLTKEQIVDDVKAVVDYCKANYPDKKVYLWGGSFGGFLGLLFLKRFPNAVEKAVLSSPAICIATEQFAQSAVAMFIGEDSPFPQEIKEQMTALSKQYWGKALLKQNYELAAVQQWFQENPMPQIGMEQFWHFYAMRDWLADYDVTSSIADIQIPTLFFMGMEDPIIPAQFLVQAVKDYPNEKVTLKTFSPCGHAVFEDCKDDFCERCIAFYKG